VQVRGAAQPGGGGRAFGEGAVQAQLHQVLLVRG
jgi:hypothetical protein